MAFILALIIPLTLWFCPSLPGLEPAAWHMFAIFLSVIMLVMSGALSMSAATLFGLSAMVLKNNHFSSGFWRLCQ